MNRIHHLLLLISFVAALARPAPARAASPGVCSQDAIQPSGAKFRICMPTGAWNGDLVVYAHGYVAFNEPLEIPEDQLSLPEGPSVPDIVNGLGFAFATTSYRTNGLAVRQGLADVIELVEVFTALRGAPNRVYLAGPSEGGIVTALGLELDPPVFDGGISACGPVGDFPSQINYWGDVRVVFDYFFPRVIPGSATNIPEFVISGWETIYQPRVVQELTSHPLKRRQLMDVARIPQSNNQVENIDAITELLWYNVFATNDGIDKLGGQPFDNRGRIYTGSDNDIQLNREVARYRADLTALFEMNRYYQTSGKLTAPLVMLHTTDPVIPFWHELIYSFKVAREERQDHHTSLPLVGRYGHCNFTTAQLLFGFVVLLFQVTGEAPADAERVLKTEEQRQEFRKLLETYPLDFNSDITLHNTWLPLLSNGSPERNTTATGD